MNAWLSRIPVLRRWWVAVAVALAPAPALAGSRVIAFAAPATEDDYVRAVVSEVAAHMEAGRNDKALAVLDAAERERPHVVFIYTRATIEELRGNCEQAAALYRQFLDHGVPPADAADARRGEDRCRAILGLPPIERDDDEADRPREPDESTETTELIVEPPPPPPPWHTDPWGGVLVFGGVAGLGAGIGLYVQSRADERATEEAVDLQSFDERSRRAERLNAAGIATMAVGSALIVGGVVRYALVGTRARRRRVAVGFGGGSRGASARVVWRF